MVVQAMNLLISQAASVPVDLSTGDALQQLINSLGGLKGATALGIAVFVVQAILLFFRTKLADFSGKWRIVIVAGLSVVVGTLSLLVSGLPITAALVHADTAAAVQVFIHQLWKQFTEKPDVVAGAEK